MIITVFHFIWASRVSVEFQHFIVPSKVTTMEQKGSAVHFISPHNPTMQSLECLFCALQTRFKAYQGVNLLWEQISGHVRPNRKSLTRRVFSSTLFCFARCVTRRFIKLHWCRLCCCFLLLTISPNQALVTENWNRSVFLWFCCKMIWGPNQVLLPVS